MTNKPQPAAQDEHERRLMVYIPDSTHHRLRVLAAEQRMSLAQVVRAALEQAARQVEDRAVFRKDHAA